MYQNLHDIQFSTSSFGRFPVEMVFGLMHIPMTDRSIEIPESFNPTGDWGEADINYLPEEDHAMSPDKIDIVWLSVLEGTFYSVERQLPASDIIQECTRTDSETGENLYSHFIVGLAPYGHLAIWLSGRVKSTLMFWVKGEKIEVRMRDFNPAAPYETIERYCMKELENNPRAKEYLAQNGLPRQSLFDDYMKQFSYRYLVLLQQWKGDGEEVGWEPYKADEDKIPEFDIIDENLYDGTHDKLHDGGLMKYHTAGKPKKIAVQWHMEKSEYAAYFWMNEEHITDIFNRFYGAHRDTPTDFIIRIDTEKKKYELALFRPGLKDPLTIPESAYQLIVFKNKFEDYRSGNYDQPPGAWVW